MRRCIPLLALLLAACPPSDDTDPVETDDSDETDTLPADTDRPDDAWGTAQDEPYLDGASLLTEAEVDQLPGDRFQISPADLAKARTEDDAQIATDEPVVRSWLADHNLTDRPIGRFLDEAPDDTRDLTEREDGTFELIVRDPETQDEINRVVTMGRRQLIPGLRQTIDRIRDPENHVATYLTLYDEVPEEVREFIPRPDEIPQFAEDDRLSINDWLIEFQDRITDLLPPPGGRPPAGRPGNCADEIGAGDNTDRTSGSTNVSSFSDVGIYNNFVWPQKWYATCVKDQANRGTCGAFGISAAMETAVALRDNEWVNLSEQDLYYRLRGQWNPSSYGDGLHTHNAWQDAISRSYIQPFEESWGYNPSRSRSANNDTSTYTSSCTNYQFPEVPSPFIPNYCSDTVHQGGSYCFNFGFFQTCGWASPVPSDNGTGYGATSETELWDATDPDFSLALTHLALVLKRPAVLWAFVTPSFDGADTDGFVRYMGDAETNRGSHIYQITGVITNEQLIDALPNAPEGSGGGYVIAKNSWGDGWADAGYVYLPFDWVKDYTISVTLLHGIR